MPEPLPSKPPAEQTDEMRRGLQMLRWAAAVLAVMAFGIAVWVGYAAFTNPDVRLERPSWLGENEAFDFSFWTPLEVTVLVGGALAGFIFWTAWRRIKSGEDLYANRMGKGVRRRNERFIEGDGSAARP
jgi:hypothetical protein